MPCSHFCFQCHEPKKALISVEVKFAVALSAPCPYPFFSSFSCIDVSNCPRILSTPTFLLSRRALAYTHQFISEIRSFHKCLPVALDQSIYLTDQSNSKTNIDASACLPPFLSNGGRCPGLPPTLYSTDLTYRVFRPIGLYGKSV
jgi:hypothetical protein